MSRRRIYLDNAATSFPKPQRVHDAMMRYAMDVGGTAGRGNYHEAREGARVINQCRDRLCRYINGESPRHVIFAHNTSDALNLAIKGIVLAAWMRDRAAPIHVVTTDMDHNSVLRPLHALRDLLGPSFEWTCVPASDEETGVVHAADLAAAIRPTTVLVATLHASNVTGVLQPVGEYGRVCRAARVNSPKPGGGVPLLVDAAQSLGHEPVDVRAMDIDLLAIPGHKGLLGPLGTGALYIRPGIEQHMTTLREGGTGSRSEREVQPAELPDRFEPGSQNAVGIAGLSEGVAFLLERGEAIYEHDRDLRRAMIEHLRDLDALGQTPGRLGLRLLGPRTAEGRVGVFSLVHDTLTPAELAAVLEQEYAVLARAGLSCAPRAHQTLGTTASGGALRLSVGPFTTRDDLRIAAEGLAHICQATRLRIGTPTTAARPAV